MRTSGRCRRAGMLAVLIGIAGGALATPSAATAPPDDVSVRVPVGPEGVTYKLPRGEDDGPPLGPPALAAGPDGSVWIDDVYAHRLLRYAPDGTRLAPLDLVGHDVLAAADLAVDGDDLYVLDVFPRVGRYRVLHLTHDGRRLGSHDVPEGYRTSDGLTGVAVDGDGSVLLELDGGSRTVQLLDAAGRRNVVERDGYRVHGRHYDVQYASGPFGPPTVVAGDVRVEVESEHSAAGALFLGATADGDFFVRVEEVDLGEGPIAVDVTIRRYSAAGRLEAVARRDVRSQFTYVEHPFATVDGDVLELSTRPDEVTVSTMSFVPALDPVLPLSPVRRKTAVDAVDASLVLSRAAFPDGASTALLARHDDPADGLATGGLQGRLGAPLLLTSGGRLDADVLLELRRLGVGTVHLLGGTAAVSADVERALQAAGMQTTRLSGADRIGTSVAVAKAHFPTAQVALLARGFAAAEPTQAFADALAVGGWAAERRWPTLLTRTDRLPAEVADYLRTAGVRQVHVVGGPAAVGDRVLADLKRMGMSVTRVAGADRAGTALAVARHRGVATADGAQGVLLLDGTGTQAWAPGVASAAYAARNRLQIVLSTGDALPAATARWLDAASSPRPLVCGPLTTRAVCDRAASALGHDRP